MRDIFRPNSSFSQALSQQLFVSGDRPNSEPRMSIGKLIQDYRLTEMF